MYQTPAYINATRLIAVGTIFGLIPFVLGEEQSSFKPSPEGYYEGSVVYSCNDLKGIGDLPDDLLRERLACGPPGCLP